MYVHSLYDKKKTVKLTILCDVLHIIFHTVTRVINDRYRKNMKSISKIIVNRHNIWHNLNKLRCLLLVCFFFFNLWGHKHLTTSRLGSCHAYKLSFVFDNLTIARYSNIIAFMYSVLITRRGKIH